MSTFAVQQETFSGPLGVLLELLEKRELEIKNVNLAKIADDYLAYLGSAEVATVEMADFLLVASRLIYLKSKELMPFLRIEEEEEAVESLEEQLRLYRMFMEAADEFEKRFAGAERMFSRPFVRVKVRQEGPVFAGLAGVTVEGLREGFLNVLKRLEPFFALQEASIERIKSVEERLEELTGAITTRSKMKFREVLAGAQSRGEVIVSFLALLELVRRNIVRATQGVGDDIEIHKV